MGVVLKMTLALRNNVHEMAFSEEEQFFFTIV